ncbi:hypothetical protein ACIA8C_03850 [Nocardia sp. NPDC051321]|uniref:hypothetical protein n=1 Tax=Nocardia sp. NPDC051321 TaxID=3364323 RepID=UPI0037B6910E
MPIDLAFFRSETSQRLRAEGRAEGETSEVVRSILDILDVRSIEVPPDAHLRITSCDDLDKLRSWLRRSATVASAAELFEA